MWRLFRRYYTEVERPTFERDLDDKDVVIVLRDSGDGSIQGFSTLKVYARKVHGRRVVAIFSGDTIIDAPYWGQSALHWTFLRFLVQVKLRHPLTPVYWFLISKGYKTYLLLARNYPHHWPRHDAPTPAFEQALLDALSADRFGEAYDREAGVLRFPESHGRLRGHVAPLSPELLAQPDVRFFAEKNPGHPHGDELCCLGRVDLAFVLRGAQRVFARPFRRRLPSREEASTPASSEATATGS
ncbi:MAG TPA: hypothetical protein RMH85_31120 [Polyangiaceae bacterium LLY-WYZ-15_(1-7)]|nr:hypothetical protein [Myxococcales bacterium]MAT26595.1 hypothetical protein [Sandaracinus sp.]HJK91691.1 hypothetical protein [Polyangiaceae bacterium LLY-WYZ-15_(1-7)]MBJ72461.1 hypothetical protein [Sandaracinus sp.]HJL01867.1 hypothetical protein [Polyangiaceae bacterium LLY-WYZ-15_(1-7)]